MNSLKVPEGGLHLDGPCNDTSVLPSQAFTLTLGSDIIEELVKSARARETLQLSLGPNPTLHYGSKSHEIAAPTDDNAYEIYLTKPFESTRKAERLLHTSNLFTRLKLPGKPRAAKPLRDTNETSKHSGSALDSDIEALQNGFAAHEAAREKAQLVDRVPGKKARAKLLATNSSNHKSVTVSPSHRTNVPSPTSTPVLTATQLAVERAKDQRNTLVHQLAVQDQTADDLKQIWNGRPEDFKSTLEKVALYKDESKRWSMKKNYWKELDVWKYDYKKEEQRQQAIDNAIRQYDNLRLSASEPEWQRLLPRSDRGKGICLSRLQATLAKGPSQPAPKIRVAKADDSSGSRDDGDSGASEKTKSDRSRSGAEPMSRSNSGKAKSVSAAKEAPPKRWVSETKKALPKKPSPTKPKIGVTKSNGARVLSQAIIENSDSSGDEEPLAKPKKNNDIKDTVVVTTRPVPVVQAKQQSTKRARDEDDSSSSSGTPLSKRLKQKQPLLSSNPKNRRVETSQGSLAARNTSYKHKNSSPTKSSPLASSPPTNASDIEPEHAPIAKKRKADGDLKSFPAKRPPVTTVPADVVNKANKFKRQYQKYEALHYEIAALESPPDEKVASLLNLRGQLENMKREIYRDCSPV